jgi:hypothetical protein
VGLLAAAATGGCDFGPGTEAAQLGPVLHVVLSRPAKETGLDCSADSPECGFPADAPLAFRFNRHLDPSTAVRQSLALYAGSAEHGVFLQPNYDVIERTVSYTHADGLLLPGVVYTVELFRATRAAEFGFRAYDGTPLAPTEVLPLDYSFRVRAQHEPLPPAQASSSDCRTALAFLTSSCGVSDCHASCSGSTCRRQPRMGLRLDSAEGLSETAIDRVARETTRGRSVTKALEGPERFGVQMPIVDPLRPDNSYLMYKLLVGPENYRTDGAMACASRVFGPLPRSDCLAPSDDERERLRDWLAPGDSMPPPGHALRSDSPIDAVRALQAWIQAGADVIHCGD